MAAHLPCERWSTLYTAMGRQNPATSFGWNIIRQIQFMIGSVSGVLDMFNGALLESWAATRIVVFILERRQARQAGPQRANGSHRRRVALTDVPGRGGRAAARWWQAGPARWTTRRGSCWRTNGMAAASPEWRAAGQAGPTE